MITVPYEFGSKFDIVLKQHKLALKSRNGRVISRDPHPARRHTSPLETSPSPCWVFNGCTFNSVPQQATTHQRQHQTRGTAQRERERERDEHIGLVYTSDIAEHSGEEANSSGMMVTQWGAPSWQDTEGVCQHLQLVLHSLQASLDLQRVVQDLDAAGERVEPHREGTLDPGHVSPGGRQWRR